MESCSISSWENDEPMIGTASDRDAYILVEARFPWKHNILESKDVHHMAAMLAHATVDGGPVKILLIAPDAQYSRTGFRRVIIMKKDQVRREFVGEEYFLPEDKEVELLLELFAGGVELSRYKGCVAKRTILVCVDGGHDKCCGLLGQPLYRKLKELYKKDIQILQTSHIGGHRFAPTFIDFPEGRQWGRVELENVENILEKKTTFSQISHMYRGNNFFTQKGQYVEKVILEKYGWRAQVSMLGDENSYIANIQADGKEIIEKYIIQDAEPVPAYGACGDPEETLYIKYMVVQEEK